MRNHRPRSVLIAEDDADTLELYACCMRAAGWVVATATTGPDAVTIARAVEPDVIVMDLELPVFDGVEATRRLKSSAETAALPVVACTASWQERSAEIEDAGFDALVSKPCTAEDLQHVLEAILAGLSRPSA